MVSKASEDLPDPETPVTTVSRLCGISKSMFFRLWTRAPRTVMLSFDMAPSFGRSLWRGAACTPPLQIGSNHAAETSYYSGLLEGWLAGDKAISIFLAMLAPADVGRRHAPDG